MRYVVFQCRRHECFGAVDVFANYSGDQDYLPSVSPSVSVTVIAT